MSETFTMLYYAGLVGFYSDKAGLSPQTYLILFGLAIIIIAVAAYMLGSINFAIIISKKQFGTDVRTLGSGNAGSTNMLRNFGKAAAVKVFAGDMLKAVFAVLLGRLIAGEIGAYIGGMFAILGHIAPCWYKFKGGKGVAAAAAMILAIDPLIFCVVLILFLLVLLITRYVSLSSIIAAFVYPAVVFFRHTLSGGTVNPFILICAVIVAFTIILMHRENLKRLYRGREPKITLRKKNRLTPEEFEEEAKKRYDDEEYVDYDSNH